MARQKSKKNVLVLNYDMTFMGFTTVKKAMIKIANGAAVALKETNERLNENYFKPLVIQLIKAMRKFYGRAVKWNKRNVFIRDGYICQYCGKHVDKPTVDHVLPKSKGVGNSWTNTATACSDCNSAKADMTCAEAKMFLKKRPVQPTIMEFLQIKAKNMNAYELLVEYGIW